MNRRAGGLLPHYKVRVVLNGAIIHLASQTEPRRQAEDPFDTSPVWAADWITDPAYGDTIGFIDWHKVTAITWRWVSE